MSSILIGTTPFLWVFKVKTATSLLVKVGWFLKGNPRWHKTLNQEKYKK